MIKERSLLSYNITWDVRSACSSVDNLEAVCVRMDKANFDFSPISLIFSMNINHYIP